MWIVRNSDLVWLGWVGVHEWLCCER